MIKTFRHYAQRALTACFALSIASQSLHADEARLEGESSSGFDYQNAAVTIQAVSAGSTNVTHAPFQGVLFMARPDGEVFRYLTPVINVTGKTNIVMATGSAGPNPYGAYTIGFYVLQGSVAPGSVLNTQFTISETPSRYAQHPLTITSGTPHTVDSITYVYGANPVPGPVL